jgi:hypothetical protein
MTAYALGALDFVTSSLNRIAGGTSAGGQVLSNGAQAGILSGVTIKSSVQSTGSIIDTDGKRFYYNQNAATGKTYTDPSGKKFTPSQATPTRTVSTNSVMTYSQSARTTYWTQRLRGYLSLAAFIGVITYLAGWGETILEGLARGLRKIAKFFDQFEDRITPKRDQRKRVSFRSILDIFAEIFITLLGLCIVILRIPIHVLLILVNKWTIFTLLMLYVLYILFF